MPPRSAHPYRFLLVRFSLLMVLLLTFPLTLLAGDEAYYGRSIVVSTRSEVSDAFKQAVELLRVTLDRMTGVTYAISIEPGPQEKPLSPSDGAGRPSIILATTDSPLVSDAMRKRFVGVDGPQAALVKSSEDGNRLWIISPTQSGLEQGVYMYLEELGCRWFITGKLWDIVPPKNDVRVRMDLLSPSGASIWPPVEIDRKDYSRKLVPFGRYGSERRNRQIVNEFSEQVYVRGDVEFVLEARANQTSITLKMRIQREEAAPTTQPDDTAPIVQLRSADGKIFQEISPRADFEWEEVKFKLPRQGAYSIRVLRASITGLQAPQRFALSLTKYRGQVLDAWKSRLYFFVPKGLFRVAIYTHSAQPITICDPEGNPVKLPRADRLVVFDVPKGMDGKAWSFTDETSSQEIEFINTPPYLAFFADGLLMPDNTDRRTDK